MEMNSPTGKKILALVRQGDYAHPGETAAIDLVFGKVPKDPSRSILDIGCGRGGTAHYVQSNGWGKVVGVDIDGNSITEAKQAYPQIVFLTADIMKLSKTLKGPFDIICAFNVFYTIPDHLHLLKELRQTIGPSGRLAVFDYLRFGENKEAFPFKDWNPLDPGAIGAHLAEAGWQPAETVDISVMYEEWYTDLVSRIQANAKPITDLAGKEWFDFTLSFFQKILTAIRDGQLGGAVLWAEPV